MRPTTRAPAKRTAAFTEFGRLGCSSSPPKRNKTDDAETMDVEPHLSVEAHAIDANEDKPEPGGRADPKKSSVNKPAKKDKGKGPAK